VTRLAWDAVGTRFYETGVDRGVLYVTGSDGVPWSGLVSIDESPSGGDADAFYIDGVKYLNRSKREEFEATINAFYSPKEFDACEGVGAFRVGVFVAQQRRMSFGLSYRTKIGNDVDRDNHGYKIHIIYNALVSPAQRSHGTQSDSNDISVLSWGITTRPVRVPGFMYSAHLIIDSTLVPSFALTSLENILYGDESHAARLPDPVEIAGLFEDSVEFTVTDTGDGDSFEISGSELSVFEGPTDTFTLTSGGVSLISSDIAELTSA
jgi:hypothetical protein